MQAGAPPDAAAVFEDRSMLESTVPCIRASGDTRPEAVRLWQLFDQEQRSAATQAVFAQELTALRTATDQDFVAAKDARRKANASPEWQAVLQAFADWQADDAKAADLLDCMERSGMHCQVASGGE